MCCCARSLQALVGVVTTGQIESKQSWEMDKSLLLVLTYCEHGSLQFAFVISPRIFPHYGGTEPHATCTPLKVVCGWSNFTLLGF